MDDELTRLDEGFPASGALMRPLTCVDAHVSLQFAAVLETASAVGATVNLLTYIAMI